MTRMPVRVVCRHCRQPIELVPGFGWLHGDVAAGTGYDRCHLYAQPTLEIIGPSLGEGAAGEEVSKGVPLS